MIRATSMLPLLVALVGCPQPVERPPPPVPDPAPIPSPTGSIAYTVRFPAPQTHTLEVEATFATGGQPLELMMATWTPGSYLIREYARHVEGLRAWGDGVELPVRKTAKNRWTIDGDADPVVVRYQVYGREMTVRTNFIDADLAVINGAPTFLTPVGRDDEPRSVRLDVPDRWEVATSLPKAEEGVEHYAAADYDTLVDTPIVMGTLSRYPFVLRGVPHELVIANDDGVWDGARSALDVDRITRAQVDFWGGMPYRRYLFLNVLGEAGGGLEHLDSTLMLASRWDTGTREAYVRWLGLVSHELFHAWNGKRLRPEALGPFDYEREAYTDDLWVVEGLTSYYDELLLARAGLITTDEYLELLSAQLESVQSTPGRLVHPLSATSFDAWIKFYRPDESSVNTTVSYYRKGALVGWLLDAEIRRRTGGTRSLDDVMRLAYARHSGDTGYTSAAFRAAASEVAGSSLDDWFAAAVDGAGELDYGPALSWYGLRFAPIEEASADGPVAGWLGVTVRSDNTVERVLRGTPGSDAGLAVGDEVLAIGDHRVPPGGVDARLRHHPPGSAADILVSRRGKLTVLPVTFGAAPSEVWTLEIHPGASAQATRQREAWLGG